MSELEYPVVSIIIPVYNEEHTIGVCLDSLLALDYPKEKMEIIIVDDGSTDSTTTILEEYPVLLLKSSHQGPSVARNLGIASARGDYIAFTDADCIVESNWLVELLKGFADSVLCAGVGGSQISAPDDSYLAKRIQNLLELLGFLGGYVKNYEKVTTVEHNASCNVIYKADILKKSGGFLPGLFPGEDVELDYRIRKMGYSLRFQPTAVVSHYRPKNVFSFFRMIYNYGKGSGGFLFVRHGIVRSLQLLFPLFLILLIIELILMSQNLFLFTIFHLIMLSIGCAMIYWKTRTIRGTAVVLLLFLMTIISWNLGFLRGLFWKLPEMNIH